jgi:hypothetical protein
MFGPAHISAVQHLAERQPASGSASLLVPIEPILP